MHRAQFEVVSHYNSNSTIIPVFSASVLYFSFLVPETPLEKKEKKQKRSRSGQTLRAPDRPTPPHVKQRTFLLFGILRDGVSLLVHAAAAVAGAVSPNPKLPFQICW